MPVSRLLLVAVCVLLPSSGWGQQRSGPGTCPPRPAECQVSTPVFNFGRQTMNPEAPPVYGHNTVSVTCTRAPVDGISVTVSYDVRAVPPAPTRQMRNTDGDFLSFDMFLDPARTRLWGDGNNGTFLIHDEILLDDRNRVGTRFHLLFGKVNGAQLVRPSQMLGLVGATVDYRVNCR